MFHKRAASGSLPINAANIAASLGCLHEVITAIVEPPRLAVILSPAFHCGSEAAFHFPKLFFIDCCMRIGAQAAVTQVA